MIYLIGSLKDPYVREVAEALRDAGHDVFDDWHASGPYADTGARQQPLVSRRLVGGSPRLCQGEEWPA